MNSSSTSRECSTWKPSRPPFNPATISARAASADGRMAAAPAHAGGQVFRQVDRAGTHAKQHSVLGIEMCPLTRQLACTCGYSPYSHALHGVPHPATLLGPSHSIGRPCSMYPIPPQPTPVRTKLALLLQDMTPWTASDCGALTCPMLSPLPCPRPQCCPRSDPAHSSLPSPPCRSASAAA